MERTVEQQASPDQLEAQVTGIWRRVLVLDGVTSNKHFFDLGGDSLAATLIAEELGARFSINVTPGDVYANPTVECLVKLVQQRVASGS